METYPANATYCNVNMPLSINNRYILYAFTNSRYSATTTAHYATESTFVNSTTIQTKILGIAGNTAIFVAENTSFKYIAVGKA